MQKLHKVETMVLLDMSSLDEKKKHKNTYDSVQQVLYN